MSVRALDSTLFLSGVGVTDFLFLGEESGDRGVYSLAER